MKRSSLTSLPIETWYHILQNLTFADIKRNAVVCKQWNETAHDGALLKHAELRQYPDGLAHLYDVAPEYIDYAIHYYCLQHNARATNLNS